MPVFFVACYLVPSKEVVQQALSSEDQRVAKPTGGQAGRIALIAAFLQEADSLNTLKSTLHCATCVSHPLEDHASGVFLMSCSYSYQA